jgi:hypothetical protein
MKKITILALTYLLFMYGAIAQNGYYSNYTYYYSDEDYRDASDYDEVINMLTLDGYTISEERVADLKQGETAYTFKTFLGPLKYIIVGISDDPYVYDVDLQVYDGDRYTYAKDDKPNKAAVTRIYPYGTEEMEVVIKNARSYTPNYKSTCKFVIAYK